jgi:hypothetical protein
MGIHNPLLDYVQMSQPAQKIVARILVEDSHGRVIQGLDRVAQGNGSGSVPSNIAEGQARFS